MAGTVSRFECSVCLESFNKQEIVPKLLPCIHTLCQSCLIKLINNAGKGKKFDCPVCRCDIKVPKEGVHGFKTNIYLIPDKDVTSQKNNSKGACSFCAVQEIYVRTLPCGHDLCLACVQATATSSFQQRANNCPVCDVPPPIVPRRLYPVLQPQTSHNDTAPSDGNCTGKMSPSQPPETRPRLKTPEMERKIKWPLIDKSPVIPSAPELEPEPEPDYNELEPAYETIFNVKDPLEAETWYVGSISRQESTQKLESSAKENGCFLVRKTTKTVDQAHCYTLDVLHDMLVYCIKILRRSDGKFYLGRTSYKPEHFDDVPSLIEYHKHEPVGMTNKITGKEFAVKLKCIPPPGTVVLP